MAGQSARRLTLPGLDSARVRALAALVAEIAGACAHRPWMAPALMLAEPAVARTLTLPEPGPDEVLIHDYQAMNWAAEPLPLDAPLAADCTRQDKGGTCELTVRMGDTVLRSALRRVPRAEIAGARPMTLPRAEPDTRAAGPITQGQVDRYLALSGDPNPIHRDAGAAHALGLPAPVVPGLLLLSVLQPAAEAAEPRAPTQLRCRFAAPLTVGAPFRIAVQRRQENRLRLMASTPDNAALAIADLAFG